MVISIFPSSVGITSWLTSGVAPRKLTLNLPSSDSYISEGIVASTTVSSILPSNPLLLFLIRLLNYLIQRLSYHRRRMIPLALKLKYKLLRVFS